MPFSSSQQKFHYDCTVEFYNYMCRQNQFVAISDYLSSFSGPISKFGSFRTPKVKQHCRRQYFGGLCLSTNLRRDRWCDGVKFSLHCVTAKLLTLQLTRWDINAGMPSTPWRLRIVMACRRINLRVGSLTVGNSLLHICSPMLNPLNGATRY